MSSNLLKRNWIVIDEEDKRIINSNAVLEKRLKDDNGLSEEEEPLLESEEEQDDFSGEFKGGLAAEELAGLVVDEDTPAVIKAESPPPLPPEPVYEGPSPEELIEEAQAQIREMKAAAQNEAEQMKRDAVEAGRQEGMAAGYEEGLLRAKEEEEKTKAKLEEDYNKLIRELEPEFVKYMTGIYEHVFRVDLSGHRNMVMHLLEGCIERVEHSNDYLVHVSTDDYSYVSEQKKILVGLLDNPKATLEIIEDMTLRKNECMIETDGGIYDCSLDGQLESLKKELLLLAYEPRE